MTLTIPANDHGKIRIFELDTLLPGLQEKTPEAMIKAFGTDGLNPDFVDVVDLAALGEMTLADFLQYGYDITPDPVDRAAVNALTAFAVLVMSRATGGEEMTLSLAPGLRHVTTCGDAAKLDVPQVIPTEAAKGVIEDAPATPARSDAAIGGRVAVVALLVLFALVAVMVWIGG